MDASSLSSCCMGRRREGARAPCALLVVATTCLAARARADEVTAPAAPADAGAAPPGTPEVQQVQVRGDPVLDPIAPRDRGVAGSVLRRDRLAAPGMEAQDALRSEPGVIVTESGGFGAPATAAIRGATAEDTPVYLAGVRLNDDVGGTADLSLVPLWLIDRIEVYRGNAPLEADRLGAGGAIFFEPRWPARDMGGIGYYGGSWGASKGWAYQGMRSGRVSALVGVSADRATNRYPFLNDNGELFEPKDATTSLRQNADESTFEAWGLGRIDLGGGATIDLLVNQIGRDQGVPSLALLPTRAAREIAERTLASIAVRAPVGAYGRVVVDARTSMLIGQTSYHDPLLELDLYTRDLEIVGRRVEQTLGATIDVTDSLRLRPLVNLAHEGIERVPDDIPLGHARREFARVALAAEENTTSWLTLRALGSLECHDTGTAPGAVCDVLAPTGRLGAQAATRRIKVLANVGRYIRVPTLGEVYGVSGTVHGNPELTPESGYTTDLGVRAQTPRWWAIDGAYVDAFVFAHWVDGLIAYEHTAQGYVTPYNVGRARVLGAELLTGIAVTKIMRAEVALTALDPIDTSPNRTTVNDVLPYRSRLISAPRLRADWKKTNRDGLSGVGGEIGAIYQSSRYVDPAGLGVIAQQTTVDLALDATWFDGLLTVRGRVADLFNAKRTDIIGYPLPGRSAYFGLEASW